MSLPPPGVTAVSPAFPAVNITISPPPNTSVVPAPPPPSSGLSKQTLAALVVGIGLGGLIVLIAVGVFVFFHQRKKRKRAHNDFLPNKADYFPGQDQHQHNVTPPVNNVAHQSSQHASVAPIPPSTSSSLGSDNSHPPKAPGISMPFSNRTFTYEELALATDNFSSVNLLGQGGFGYVHKGVLPDGKEIAVKQSKAGSAQGEREFQAEVETISRVHHRHLVSLVGYCISGDHRMLVYEYIPNKTLEFHLHEVGRPTMSWATRLKISLGSAKGLAYLHEECHPKIIHRDIKAANILLDNDFEAKVADFGLAKFSFDVDTHVSTRVMGTFGYLAPEYAASGKLTEKSDVFSFGVVLLELITGRRPVDKARPFMDDSMVEWARPLLMQALESGSFDILVDQRLDNYDSSEMTQMVACAAACVRGSARRRPQMSQIVRALEGNLCAEDLLKETPIDKRTFQGSSDYDSSSQYQENLKKFKKLALESQDLSTSEHSVFTGEHGGGPSTSSTDNQRDTQEIEIEKSKTGKLDVFEIPIE